MEEPSEDALAEARRYLADIMVFEGAEFIVPSEVAEDQAAVPEAFESSADKGEIALGMPEPSGQIGPAEIAPDEATDAGSADPVVDESAVRVTGSGTDPAVGAALAVGENTADLEAFRQQICECTSCPLGLARKNFVFGAGDPGAGIMFVGEAPGADEDREGEPFVGAAGQLLNKIIAAMNLRREEVYICNILKCRPPNNRDPQPDEIEQCEPYLKRQIEIIEPKVICTLGRFAAQTLLRSSESMGRMRGQTHSYEGIPLVATYHPAALLRNAQWKRPTWEDIKRVRQIYDGVEL